MIHGPGGSPLWDSFLKVGSLPCQQMLGSDGSDKHSSLVRYGSKKYYSTGPIQRCTLFLRGLFVEQKLQLNSSLTPALGATKFITIIAMHLVTLCCATLSPT